MFAEATPHTFGDIRFAFYLFRCISYILFSLILLLVFLIFCLRFSYFHSLFYPVTLSPFL